MLLAWFKTLIASVFRISNSKKVTSSAGITNTYPQQSAFEEHMPAQDTGLSIPFYPSLINHLEMDHKHLLDLYTQIAHTLSSKEYQLITTQLLDFKAALKDHLESENIKFYGYLEQSLKHQTQQFTALRHFRKEMRSIERTVIKFLDYWIENGVDRFSAHQFESEYQTIGAALVKRIESEEKELYTMYAA